MGLMSGPCAMFAGALLAHLLTVISAQPPAQVDVGSALRHTASYGNSSLVMKPLLRGSKSVAAEESRGHTAPSAVRRICFCSDYREIHAYTSPNGGYLWIGAAAGYQPCFCQQEALWLREGRQGQPILCQYAIYTQSSDHTSPYQNCQGGFTFDSRSIWSGLYVCNTPRPVANTPPALPVCIASGRHAVSGDGRHDAIR